MMKEEKITNIDWKNQTFETENGDVLPFAMNEDISMITEAIESLDNVIYVYKPKYNDEKE